MTTHLSDHDHHHTPTDHPLQDIWHNGTCYGCGPANPHGLQIKSYWSETENAALCTFQGQPYHNAGFDNVMYGGLVASLCDCHSIWAAIAVTYRHEGRDYGSAPSISYVTGNLNVSFRAPTPLDRAIVVKAHVQKVEGRKALIHTVVLAGETITAEAQVLAIRIPLDKALGATMG